MRTDGLRKDSSLESRIESFLNAFSSLSRGLDVGNCLDLLGKGLSLYQRHWQRRLSRHFSRGRVKFGEGNYLKCTSTYSVHWNQFWDQPWFQSERSVTTLRMTDDYFTVYYLPLFSWSISDWRLDIPGSRCWWYLHNLLGTSQRRPWRGCPCLGKPVTSPPCKPPVRQCPPIWTGKED